MTRRIYISVLAVISIFLSVSMSITALAANGAYGDGTYGSCTYNSCGISLSSSSVLNVNVTPGSSTTCSVQSDGVAVTTDSSTGYTLTVTTNSTNNSLSSGTGSIAATSALAGAPATLSASKWGYRVDGVASFGAGPTNAVSNGSVPTVTFAAVPTSSQTADTVASSSSAADPAITTTVWYGVCLDSSVVAGTYTTGVVYTAVVN